MHRPRPKQGPREEARSAPERSASTDARVRAEGGLWADSEIRRPNRPPRQQLHEGENFKTLLKAKAELQDVWGRR